MPKFTVCADERRALFMVIDHEDVRTAEQALARAKQIGRWRVRRNDCGDPVVDLGGCSVLDERDITLLEEPTDRIERIRARWLTHRGELLTPRGTAARDVYELFCALEASRALAERERQRAERFRRALAKRAANPSLAIDFAVSED